MSKSTTPPCIAAANSTSGPGAFAADAPVALSTESSAAAAAQRAPANPGLDAEALFVALDPVVTRLLRAYGPQAELSTALRADVYHRFRAHVGEYAPECGVPLRPYLVRQLTASVESLMHLPQYRADARARGAAGHTASSGAPGARTTSCHEQPSGAELKWLPHAIALLPDVHSKVLLWRFYDALSFEEIARLLGAK
jgi:DNA-directed RNA polymerase specialized sigma24 family protein